MEDVNPPPFYNTDAGNKTTLATSVIQSPYQYAIMRSNTERFRSATTDVPFAVYNLDTGQYKTVESRCRDSRRFYAATFQSAAPRFLRPLSSEAADKIYDTERLKDFNPDSLGKCVKDTPVKYSIHRSKYKRFSDKPLLSEAPDLVYVTDAGNKESLYTSMLHSSLRYSGVGRSTTERAPLARRDNSKGLGPGSYDSKNFRDVAVSGTLKNMPLSSLASSTPRFKSDPVIGIGSTWRQERDTKVWAKNGTTMPKAGYLRPAYVPKIMGTKEFAS